MLVSQASVTRSPFKPSSTARAAWAWSNRLAAKMNRPSSPRSVQMGAGRLKHRQAVIGGPLEQVAQIMAVRVERPAAAAGQERHSRQLASSGATGPRGMSSSAESSRVVISGPRLLVVDPGNTRKGRLAW
jgi:hypothetical protein